MILEAVSHLAGLRASFLQLMSVTEGKSWLKICVFCLNLYNPQAGIVLRHVG